MKTNLTIEQIAELIGERLWKGTRIYVNSAGHNTKKMKTNAYIYMVGNEIKFSVFIECNSQPAQWIESQKNEVIDYLTRKVEAVLPADEVVEPVLSNESDTIVTPAGELVDLNEVVYGFTTEWRLVNVKINNYGKMAERRRQFIQLLAAAKKDAPRDFYELGEQQYNLLAEYHKSKEWMIEPEKNDAGQYKTALETINDTVGFILRVLKAKTNN
jgi:hypothetical protein